MKTSKILAVAALSLVAAVGVAQAEQYQGVTTVNSVASRAEVNSQAVVAAHSANPYAEGANAGVPAPLVAQADRNAVRAGAVAAAHDPTWNLDRKAFVNSTIPSQYTQGSLAVRRAATRSAGL
ncbi:MAG: hypothetical protein REJ24_15760 [Rhodocyclaceae bacterium]|nr:alpha/beta hydrolase [Pseudomonadota bacterium]MDQ7974027.1 hypothetical protein [Rhodocyclaceae bacterium]MDQ8000199.1 alpha/beta hydrolase [Pseudomonadota bacterium]MDQ8018615.1 alpha/beta hydrolase [Pseudomonadota bacterium]